MSDLREYISQVKKIKELKTIKTKVSTKYEIAGITATVDQSYAVLFENIKESDFRLVSNLVGTRKRFALAVGGTESNDKIGSMIVSLATGPTPTTTTIIPSRSESLFLRLIAERISTRMKGIALVSTYIQKELETSTAKALMSEIMEMIENE